ncbi:hypothetical protein [Streptomyces sp. NBC_01474]|uniref:hypothetical protein n=1 Tax=Streptomyces sp. NBC_01474 TaxID=2903880 RepID=UPI002DD84141|nr:hypothetical protein [Streptomyces sp. NBC_01474]
MLHNPSGNVCGTRRLSGQLHKLRTEFLRWLAKHDRAEHQLQHQAVVLVVLAPTAVLITFHQGLGNPPATVIDGTKDGLDEPIARPAPVQEDDVSSAKTSHFSSMSREQQPS